MSKIEIKNHNKSLHIDYLEMILKFSPAVKVLIKQTGQIVVNDETILIKDLRGKYLKTLSLNDELVAFEKAMGL